MRDKNTKVNGGDIYMSDGYADLANGIVMQAVKDYRWALKTLKSEPKDKQANKMKRDVERFFKSKWFKSLTSISPKLIIEHVISEVSA